MRSAAVVFSVLVVASSSHGETAPAARARLERLLVSDVSGWRFKLGECPGAETPDWDDSDWARVAIGHRWWPHDSTCWFRTRIRIPDRINGIDVTGSTVRLKLGVDNGAEPYVDGRRGQQFEWSDGDVVLTRSAKPGQTFCVALHAVNGPGYGMFYQAYLVSSASEKMVDALRALLHESTLALSDGRYVPEVQARHWEGLVEQACQAVDLVAYRAGKRAQLLQSIERAQARLLSDRAGFEASLRATAAKLARLKVVIEQGKRAGLQLAYRQAEARVVESFIEYAREDMADGEPAHALRGLKIAAFLDRLCDRALEQAAACLDNPALDLRVPTYRTGPVAIRDGAFWQGGRPLFFTGVGHFGQVRRDTPILTEYGLNIIQIEMGPSAALPDADTVDAQAIRQNVVTALDKAAAHDVAVNLLISPHYFPAWALDRNPKLAECGRGFLKYCIEAPDARAVIEKFLRALMPMIAHHPALHSICLSNEPQYSGKCAYARAGFRKWLQRKHGTIQTLNEVYGTDFHAFEDVPIPDDRSNYGLFFDWCGYNQDRFLEFHEFERRIIRQYDRDLPVHAKIQAHDLLASGWFERGVNYEDFDQLGSIIGNDCVQTFVGDRQGEYLQDWPRMALSYTLQRCAASGRPIFNSEDHIIADGDQRFIPASHIRTAFWTQALYGQGAATTWVWERNQGGDAAENILTRPNCVVALGRIALDLNRLAGPVVALEHAAAPLAILYSYSSQPIGRDHSVEVEAAFEGACFSDTVCDIVTERQVVAGRLRDYKVVIVPHAAHTPDAVVEAVQKYIAAGGTVMMVSSCFTHDQYGLPRGRRLEPAGHGRLVVYPDPLTARAYREIFNGLLDAAGAQRTVRISGPHGESIWGVHVRTATWKGSRLVALVSFSRRDQTIQLAVGRPIDRAVNLFDNADVTLPLTLAPLEPVLLSIKTDVP